MSLVRSVLLTMMIAAPPLCSGAEEGITGPPKLAVLISVDQMRGGYLEKFQPWFGTNGFRRFIRDGAVYSECSYLHSNTKTAPGHATIATGASPSAHGIIANEWVDPRTWKPTAGVEDAASPLVGSTPKGWRSPGGVFEARDGRSPHLLLATTVGDQLKLRHPGVSRVISIAGKDRSAILMGGRRADGAYWLNGGRAVTSTYYRDALPEWAEAFNERRLVETYHGRVWDRVAPVADYDRVQGPDDADGENNIHGLGRVFPRTIDGGSSVIGKDFFEAFTVSPFANEVLLELVKTAVRDEGLGTRNAPDLLAIGFSQPDSVGHFAGPDSHEVMDTYLRLDRVLGELFAFLDQHVGLDKCVIVLTSDHGVAPLPERTRATRPEIPAGRVKAGNFDAAVIAALDAAFGKPPADHVWLLRDSQGYRLSDATIRAKKIPREKAALVVRDALLKLDTIAAAYTREEILSTKGAEGRPYLTSVRKGHHPERGQDVAYVMRPYFVETSALGTNHGTPHDYDTHVPLLWLGRGVPVGRHAEAVSVTDLAPTLAALLGVARPPEAEGRRLF